MKGQDQDLNLQGVGCCPECQKRWSKCKCLDEEELEEEANKWEAEE